MPQSGKLVQAERAFRCRDPGGLAIAALQPLSWIRTLGIPVLLSGGARSMGIQACRQMWTEIMGRGDHDGHDGHDGLDEEQAHAQVHRGQQGSVLLRVRGWPEGKNRGILTSVPRDPDPGMPSSKPWADREMPRGSGRQALACLCAREPRLAALQPTDQLSGWIEDGEDPPGCSRTGRETLGHLSRPIAAAFRYVGTPISPQSHSLSTLLYWHTVEILTA
ncbi:hypothetical protein A1Q2_07832 [Trichosporon asahii var. asahii CBS 8904]|uniref:Uncharacterized protein n=1 Tax=Trichosporon asahii var. asahii (strain CBS 8904) TaxID=1220162 RepID=K1V1L1_TRIAC|nr:hypothetical protein A1Q2_07832 [Trichosporon asahii var. asahii CBS 8904]